MSSSYLNGPKLIDDFDVSTQRLWTGIGERRPSSYERIVEMARGLFAMSPLQPGDTAELVHVPVIDKDNSWGWLGSKHLFTLGNRVTVRSIDFFDGAFIFGVEFERETWIPDFGPDRGVEREVSKKAIYCMPGRWLRKVL